MARTAQVKRDARIGEAEARRDSQIKVTKANLIYLYLFIFASFMCSELKASKDSCLYLSI